MNAVAIVGIAVGVLTILAALGRGLWAVHKGVNVVQDTREDVARLHALITNGLTTKIDLAAERSKRAEHLAADAARAASVASQRVVEGQQEVSRAVNALRSEVDIYTNVVLSDRHRIREALRDLGQDISDDEGAL